MTPQIVRARRVLPVLLVSAALAGCATVPREAGFGDVAADVQARGGYEVAWLRGAPEEASAAAAVEALLADTLTLDEAVQVALLNNRRLQATYEDLGVAQAAVVQAGLLRNPIFGGDAAFPFEGGAPDLGLEVAFDFLDIFYRPLRLAVAEGAFDAAKLRVAGAVLDLAGSVRAAYLGAQADQQRLELFEQVAQAAEASYEVAIRLHAAGNIPDLDLHQERALHEQARLALAAARLAADGSRERLNTLLGLWGEALAYTLPRRLPPVPDVPEMLEDVEARAVAASLELGVARREIETYGRRLGLANTTALVPELEAGAVAERDEGAWKAGPSASLAIPLFDFGQARRAAAAAELRSRQQAYYATGVEVRAAARTAAARLLTARRIAEHYRTVLLPLRVQITRETQLQYNAMQVGVFQLLQARTQEVETARQYIDALEAYWLARTDLELLLEGRMSRLSAGLEAGSMMIEPSERVEREEH